MRDDDDDENMPADWCWVHNEIHVKSRMKARLSSRPLPSTSGVYAGLRQSDDVARLASPARTALARLRDLSCVREKFQKPDCLHTHVNRHQEPGMQADRRGNKLQETHATSTVEETHHPRTPPPLLHQIP